jgi:hypothetical protein
MVGRTKKVTGSVAAGPCAFVTFPPVPAELVSSFARFIGATHSLTHGDDLVGVPVRSFTRGAYVTVDDAPLGALREEEDGVTVKDVFAARSIANVLVVHGKVDTKWNEIAPFFSGERQFKLTDVVVGLLKKHASVTVHTQENGEILMSTRTPMYSEADVQPFVLYDARAVRRLFHKSQLPPNDYVEFTFDAVAQKKMKADTSSNAARCCRCVVRVPPPLCVGASPLAKWYAREVLATPNVVTARSLHGDGGARDVLDKLNIKFVQHLAEDSRGLKRKRMPNKPRR